MPADLSNTLTLTPGTWAWHRARMVGAWRQAIGWVYEKIGLPGLVRPMDFYDRKTERVVSIRVDRMFTVICVGERDYWFNRRDGKFDGTGTPYSCPTHDSLAAGSTRTDTEDLTMAYHAGRSTERATLLASLIEKVEGKRDAYRHASDCTPAVRCTCSAGDVHDFAEDVLTLLRTEAENG